MSDDPTELKRRIMVTLINSQVESQDEQKEKERLKKLHKVVLNKDELTAKYDVKGFLAPFVIVVEKSTGKNGCLMFQHFPRFYFDFESLPS